MADAEIVRRVVAVAARVLGLEPGEIKPDDNFVFDLGAESVQSVALVSAFETEFDVEMDRDQALTIQTVAGAADFIAGHLKK